MSSEALRAAEEKMRADGQATEAVAAFRSAYERVEAGEQATIASSELEPASDVPALGELTAEPGPDMLDRFALVKLNGGLATSMGLEQPKSLLEAREGRTFLQIIVGQILALRERHGIRLPLVLMDSEATQEPTLAALAEHPELRVEDLPLDFLQSMIPKLERETLAPVDWPAAPALEWCPPGHGDIYGSLRSSGMLAALLERGFHYAMISNADNLGSAFEPRIAAHVIGNEIPFLMEVVEGTEADRKGGHIARRRSDGRLVLRETAQTPPEDEESFRDFRRWRFYNTNSLWVDLRVLERTLDARGGVLELPLIV
ncbi:MAG TPA: UTP--glucose-1-phosphate uridylyltransferase, partial [Solirubrobacteraceae bacterium]|nr:UTP--glucose-1-phosphate uridylyltransferase [Solirubrobacteraceae bacterium]